MQTTRQTLNVGGIWVLPLTGERIPRPFVQSPGAAYDGQFSPNGRWVAYTSKESREKGYVVPFDAVKVLNTGHRSLNPSSGGKWQISPRGGHFQMAWGR
jgi:Tol biopolymer transport system component